MKKSKLKDCFHRTHQKINAWWDECGEALAIATAVGILVSEAAYCVKGLYHGGIKPFFAQEPTALEQTVDADTNTVDANITANELGR